VNLHLQGILAELVDAAFYSEEVHQAFARWVVGTRQPFGSPAWAVMLEIEEPGAGRISTFSEEDILPVLRALAEARSAQAALTG